MTACNRRLVAIFDAGKSRLKLSVVDPATLEVVYFRALETPWLMGPPYAHLDHEAAETFLTVALRQCPLRACLAAIVPIGHGAAAALIGPDGRLAAPVLDYEDASIEAVDAQYEARRDEFADTLSPALPLGLNLGRQLFFLKTACPDLYDRATIILPYPQYWAYRMSGIAASEVTSLGCHTDLWLPRTGQFSPLATSQGFAARFAPLRQAGDCLGRVCPDFAARAGLAQDVQAYCGIHDSNASYLGHRIDHRGDMPAVISSGTWLVIMAGSADPARLTASRDHLANVDACGGVVPTARFMGGREYEAIAGPEPVAPSAAALDVIMQDGVLALPSFASGGGPFRALAGRISSPRALSGVERATLATLYVALVADQCLSDLGVAGDIVVEGPLTGNPLFGSVLAALRVGQRILLADGEVASRRAACILSGAMSTPGPSFLIATPHRGGLADYRHLWRDSVETPECRQDSIQPALARAGERSA